MDLEPLKKAYLERRLLIEKRLEEFKSKRSDLALFAELAFCLLTPQSKARACWSSIENLEKRGILFSDAASIRPCLKCRFGNNKARYVEGAGRNFVEIKKALQNSNSEAVRQWLVMNVRGLGYKEASHFLRNIGIEKFAILDRHILKNLKKYGVIEEIPKTLTKKKYLEIEAKMEDFAKKIGIPMSHLDLLFWSEETGEIFK